MTNKLTNLEEQLLEALRLLHQEAWERGDALSTPGTQNSYRVLSEHAPCLDWSRPFQFSERVGQ